MRQMMNSMKHGVARRVMAILLSLVMSLSLGAFAYAEEAQEPAVAETQEALTMGLEVVASLVGAVVDVYKEALPQVASIPVDQLFSGSADVSIPAFNGGLRLDLSEAGAGMITNMAGVDLSWLKSAEIDFTVGGKSLNLYALLNEMQLLTGYLTYDAENTTVYAQVPELSPSILKADLAPYLEQMSGSVQEAFGMMQKVLPVIAEYLPEGSVVTEILNRYIAIIVSYINKVADEAEVLEPEFLDMTKDVTARIITISQEDLANMAVAVIDAAKEDEQLKNVFFEVMGVLPALAEAAPELGVPEVDPEQVWASFLAQLDSGRELMYPSTTEGGEAEEGNYLQLKLYTDENGMFCGCAFAVAESYNESITEYVHLYVLNDGEKTGIELAVSDGDYDMFSFAGTGMSTETGYNGTYDIMVSGTNVVSFDIVDAAADMDGVHGSIIVRAGSGLAMMVGGSTAAMLTRFSLKLGWQFQTGLYIITLSVLDPDNAELATLSLGVAPGGEVTEIMPADGDTVYDVMAGEAQAYASEIDIQALLAKAVEAGVPQELIGSLMGQ